MWPFCLVPVTYQNVSKVPSYCGLNITSLSLKTEWYSTDLHYRLCLPICQFISRGFPFLATINGADRTFLGVLFLILSNTILGEEMLGRLVFPHLTFEDLSNFCPYLHHFIFLFAMYEDFSFSLSSPTLVGFSWILLYYSYPSGYSMVPYWELNYISLRTNNLECLLICWLVIYMF